MSLPGNLSTGRDTAIGIQSNQFGRIDVRPAAIRRLHRIEENATLVFASLAGLQDWKSTNWETSGWDEDGDHLFTRQGGATLNGDLQVPDRAVVEFELAWDDKPNFVFAIGVDTESESDRNTDGWRFETVAGKLAVVREEEDAADVDTVADLSDRKSIRLSAYVDQLSGEMRVFLPDGSTCGNCCSGTWRWQSSRNPWPRYSPDQSRQRSNAPASSHRTVARYAAHQSRGRSSQHRDRRTAVLFPERFDGSIRIQKRW